MIEKIACFFDGDIMKILTGVAAIIAFVVSLSSTASTFFHRRKKLVFHISAFVLSDSFNGKKMAKIRFRVDNRSELPISITRVLLVADGKEFDNQTISHKIEEISTSRNGNIVDREVVKSSVLPICLSELGAYAGCFAFLVPQDTLRGDETALTFRICTNRGKAVQRTIVLHEDLQM